MSSSKFSSTILCTGQEREKFCGWSLSKLTHLCSSPFFAGLGIQVQNYYGKRLLLHFFSALWPISIWNIIRKPDLMRVLSRFPTNLEHYPRKCRNLHSHSGACGWVSLMWCGFVGCVVSLVLFFGFQVEILFFLVAILPLSLCIKILLYSFSLFLFPFPLLMFFGVFLKIRLIIFHCLRNKCNLFMNKSLLNWRVMRVLQSEL